MTPRPKLPPVIGFTGLAGSGKSTAARWVMANHNNPALQRFAGPLKQMTHTLIRAAAPRSWPVSATDYIRDPVLKEEPIPYLGGLTARRIMQTLGTEWGRDTIHPDFWVAIAAGKLERLLGSPFKKSRNVPIKVIYDDVRFANEAAMLRAYGGTIIRVVRPAAAKGSDIAGHESETMEFEADIVLMNDGTQQDLHDKLAALLPVPPPVPTARSIARERGQIGPCAIPKDAYDDL